MKDEKQMILDVNAVPLSISYKINALSRDF